MTAKQTPPNASPPTSAEAKRARRPLSTPIWWTREIVAIVVWIFAFVKLFVIDVDRVIAERVVPGSAGYLDYRLFVLLGVLATLWLVVGNPRFIRFVGYVAIYPFVATLWHATRLSLRHWPVLVVFYPAIHSLFTRFRWAFIFGSATVLAAFFTQVSTNGPLLVVCLLILGAFLVHHYYRRFRVAFQPQTVFADLGQTIRAAWESTQSKLITDISALDPDTDEYKKKHASNLFHLFVVASSLRMAAHRLDGFTKTRKMDIYFVATLLFTILMTTVVFAFQYQAVETIWPGSFSTQEPLHFWRFLGFSFGSLMTADVSTIRAIGPVALMYTYAELVCAVLILVLLVFVILTSVRERYREDMESIIQELTGVSDFVAARIEAEFQLTPLGAAAMLLQADPQFAKTVRYLLPYCVVGKAVAELANEAGDTVEGIDVAALLGSRQRESHSEDEHNCGSQIPNAEMSEGVRDTEGSVISNSPVDPEFD